MNWMIISGDFFVLGLVTKHEPIRGDTKGKWPKENSETCHKQSPSALTEVCDAEQFG